MYKQANLSFSVTAQASGDDVNAIQFSTQDKNSAKLIFTIKEGKAPLNLADVDGIVDLVMGDKSVFEGNKAEITGPLEGKLEYTITPEQIRHPGKVRGELKLVSKNGQTIGGFRFNFTIKKSLLDEFTGPIKEFYIEDLEAVKKEVKQKADAVVLDIDKFKVDIDSRTAAIEEQIDSLDDDVAQSTVLQVDAAKKDTTGQTHANLDSRIKAEVGKITTKQTELTTQLAEKVSKINGKTPDENGNVTIEAPQVDTSNLRSKTEPISLDDASPELLAAIEGGEGTTFNLLSIPRLASVTPETTTFVKQGKNKFSGNFSKGWTLSGTFPNLSWSNAFANAVSLYAKVEKGKTYTISKANGTDRFGIATFIREPVNGKIVNRVLNNPINNVSVFTVTLEGDEDYIAISVSSNSQGLEPAWLQIEEGSSATTFSPYNQVVIPSLQIDIKKENIPDEAITIDKVEKNTKTLLNMDTGSPEKLEANLTKFYFFKSNSGTSTLYESLESIKQVPITSTNSIYFNCNFLPSGDNGILKLNNSVYLIIKMSVPDKDYQNVTVTFRNHTASASSTVNKVAEHIGQGYYKIDDYAITENRTHRIYVKNEAGTEKKIEAIYLSSKGTPVRGQLVDTLNEIEKKVSSPSKICYVSPTGSDSADGTTLATAFATFQKAIDSGANVILARQGDYFGQTINASGLKTLEIKTLSSTIKSNNEKKGARIINTTDLELVVEGNTGLFKSALTLPTSSNWYKVFIDKSLPIEETSYVTNPGMKSYNAVLWEVNNSPLVNLDQVSDDKKLIPVLTLAECQTTQGTFFYNGTNVYVNPTGNTITGKSYKRLINEVGDIATFDSINKLTLIDIDFMYGAGRNININNVEEIYGQHVSNGYSAYSTGMRIGYSNGVFRKCYAYKNRTDGFAPTGNGDTHFYDCEGLYNYDDGISHHNECTGSITGGEYHHNGKGGVSPAHGAKVDLYNIISHHNGYGFYCEADTDTIIGRKVRHAGCVAYNNTYGISARNYHVLAYNCKYTNNTTSKQVTSNTDSSIVEL